MARMLYSRPTAYRVFLWSSRLILLAAVLALIMIFARDMLGPSVAAPLTIMFASLTVGFFAVSFVSLLFLKCDICKKSLYAPWKLLVFERHPKNLAADQFSCSNCGQMYTI